MGKRVFVLALGGAPVSGGARALGSCGIAPEGGRATLGIGFVTAVDQAGAVGACGTAVKLGGCIGIVVAAEILGRGVIFVDAGLRGLGGRLIRRVSLFGRLMSDLLGGGGAAESAIMLFILIYGKCTMAKLAIAT